VINQAGFLDASVLGEVVTPRDFNTLRRIADEDNAVIDEQESFLELASSEALLAELQRVLATEARQWLTNLDDGIHSGLQRRLPVRHLLLLHRTPSRRRHESTSGAIMTLLRREIIDNRYQIMQLIACGPETPRHPPPYAELRRLRHTGNGHRQHPQGLCPAAGARHRRQARGGGAEHRRQHPARARQSSWAGSQRNPRTAEVSQTTAGGRRGSKAAHGLEAIQRRQFSRIAPGNTAQTSGRTRSAHR
jgi:hypothetical protein